MKPQLKEQNNHRSAYIGAMTAELAEMARTDDLRTLAVLLDMATLEAHTVSGKPTDERRH